MRCEPSCPTASSSCKPDLIPIRAAEAEVSRAERERLGESAWEHVFDGPSGRRARVGQLRSAWDLVIERDRGNPHTRERFRVLAKFWVDLFERLRAEGAIDADTSAKLKARVREFTST